MRSSIPSCRTRVRRLAALTICLSLLTACGGGSGGDDPALATGAATIFLSDPPTCGAPAGSFNSVWVTITGVRAHLSANAEDGQAGWVDLLDLSQNPVQLDLLNLGTTSCLVSMLGGVAGLPPGDYQQLRLQLLSNDPDPAAAVPDPNACAATGGFNCVDHATLGLQLLQLGSQANTGLKIPPGQIAGGAITITAGQSADINVDLDACRSVVQQGNGGFRLKPTLTAGQISLTDMGMSGRVVDAATGAPIPNGTVIVLAEQPDALGTDRVVRQVTADPATGVFTICPLPMGLYDLVIAAIDPAGLAYGATVTFEVPVGMNLGDIPLIPNGASVGTVGMIDGTVTSVDGGATPAGSSIDVELSALQEVMGPGDTPTLVTVPVFPGSATIFPTEGLAICPAGTYCNTYLLIVPSTNPSVGTYDPMGATTWGLPDPGLVLYTVLADARMPNSGGLPTCAPSLISTNLDGGEGALAVTAGASITAAQIDFVGCGVAP